MGRIFCQFGSSVRHGRSKAVGTYAQQILDDLDLILGCKHLDPGRRSVLARQKPNDSPVYDLDVMNVRPSLRLQRPVVLSIDVDDPIIVIPVLWQLSVPNE